MAYPGKRISELLSLKVGDVYQHGRVGDVVYVERKHMKKKMGGPLFKATINVGLPNLEQKRMT
jgi:hypothetical protein